MSRSWMMDDACVAALPVLAQHVAVRLLGVGTPVQMHRVEIGGNQHVERLTMSASFVRVVVQV